MTNPNPVELKPRDWQSMDTAPKDGTEIIGLVNGEECRVQWAQERRCMMAGIAGGSGYFGPGWQDVENRLISDTPTSWRPVEITTLPSKPEQPWKVKSSEEFAYQMLGTIDATALRSRFKSIITIIEERDSQLRIQSAKAALTRAIEIADSMQDAKFTAGGWIDEAIRSFRDNLRIEDL